MTTATHTASRSTPPAACLEAPMRVHLIAKPQDSEQDIREAIGEEIIQRTRVTTNRISGGFGHSDDFERISDTNFDPIRIDITPAESIPHICKNEYAYGHGADIYYDLYLISLEKRDDRTIAHYHVQPA